MKIIILVRRGPELLAGKASAQVARLNLAFSVGDNRPSKSSRAVPHPSDLKSRRAGEQPGSEKEAF